MQPFRKEMAADTAARALGVPQERQMAFRILLSKVLVTPGVHHKMPIHCTLRACVQDFSFT